MNPRPYNERPLDSQLLNRTGSFINKQMFLIKICQCPDSNLGPLASEATALPTEPQPLAFKLLLQNLFLNISIF